MLEMILFGGPADGAPVAVRGNPLPEFVSWSAERQVATAYQFDPKLSVHAERHAVVYRLDRVSMRYRYQPA